VLVCGVYCGCSDSIDSKILRCCIVELIVVTAIVDRVQCYCVVCGDYCCYNKSKYNAMLLS